MSDATDSVLQAALKLSDQERAELVDALLDSLPPEEDFVEVTEKEFLAELERRAVELDADPSAGIPWSELKKQM